MNKMLNLAWALIISFCIGTVITQLLLAAVFYPKLKLDKERITQIAAIAQGAALPAKAEVKGPEKQESEQASYQEVVEARAVKYRNLELREQQLRNNVVRVQSEESKIAEDIKRNKQLAEGFKTELEQVRKSSTTEGMDDVLRKLIKMDPKQAKGQLVMMLDNKEMDAVVSLIKQMPDKNCANILREFKTDDEKLKLSEVLRRIREGAPEIKTVDKAQEKLQAKQ
jgi:hypothetical protein